MIVETKLSSLKVGHYVVEIKQQNDDFKLKSPSHIKSTAVIDNLADKGVKTVLIDDEKTIAAEVKNTPEVINNASTSLSKNELTPENLKSVKEVITKSKLVLNKTFSDVRNGCDIDLEPIIDITSSSVDSIFNNVDSLSCLVSIRNKSEYLLEHSTSVSVYLSIFASYLKIDKATVYQMTLGAFLHDVGKVVVPDNILDKPGKLTDEEFFIMKTHANHSADILKKTKGVSQLSYEVAAYHHEKLDGNGYPFKLKADKISKYCRMMSICDIFDALTSDRCYKKGSCHYKAFIILRNLANNHNHLDIELVEEFIKAIGAYPVGSLVQLSSNRVAIVERRNKSDSLRPGVRLFFNCEENEYQETEELDLSSSDDYIVKGVKASDFDLDMDDVIEFLIKQA